MKNFGTLEYVMDKYSQQWSWKVTGARAVSMIYRIIPQSWYGDGPDEVIIPDSRDNIQQIQWIHEQYEFEILSKPVWQRKTVVFKPKKTRLPKIEKLERAKPGEQFSGRLMNFQREGLDFLVKVQRKRAASR